MSNPDDNVGACALLLVDLQKSFFHKQGGNYYPESAAILPAISQLVDAARISERPIIFVAEQHRPHLADFESHKLPEHCIVGEFDSELIDNFAPTGPHEYLLAKRRMSAFNATDLDLLLRELDVQHLVIGGVKANVCIRATVQDGFSLGYLCHVVKDAVNSNRAQLADASLEDIDRYMGYVVSSAEAVGMLS